MLPCSHTHFCLRHGLTYQRASICITLVFPQGGGVGQAWREEKCQETIGDSQFAQTNDVLLAPGDFPAIDHRPAGFQFGIPVRDSGFGIRDSGFGIFSRAQRICGESITSIPPVGQPYPIRRPSTRSSACPSAPMILSLPSAAVQRRCRRGPRLYRLPPGACLPLGASASPAPSTATEHRFAPSCSQGEALCTFFRA